MVYGEDKSREMARSLLPSTHRRSARYSRDSIHRLHRRHFRVELRRLARDPEAFEDRADFTDEPVTEIRQMMKDRREGDKLGPFLRWANAHAGPIPRDSRMSHLRALVPPGLIGDHALSHLRQKDAFMSSAEVAIQKAREPARPRRPYRENREEMAERLRAVLWAPDGHRVFNQWLKQPLTAARPLFQHCNKRHQPRWTRDGLPPIRLLLGAHDVLPFIAALWDRKDTDPWRVSLDDTGRRMQSFLRTFEQHRGDVTATARDLGLEPAPSR